MLLPPGSTLRLGVSLALWGERVSVAAVSRIHWGLFCGGHPARPFHGLLLGVTTIPSFSGETEA